MLIGPLIIKLPGGPGGPGLVGPGGPLKNQLKKNIN